MAKSTKKKNRKLRKQIRKTVGALFMASAIVVAAVPVQDVAAEPGKDAEPEAKVWVWDEKSADKPDANIEQFCESTIPYVKDDAIVYTSGDGRFQFAYHDPGNGIKVAVLLNYNPTVLSDSTLTIPNNMEAFRKYKTTSTEGYYCLVTQDDEFMFYDVYEQDRDDSNRLLYTVPEVKYDTDKHPVPADDLVHNVGDSIVVNRDQLVTREDKLVYVEKVVEKDEEGNDVEVEKIYQVDELMVTHQKPCYYEQRDVWGELDDTELYYQKKGSVTVDKPNGELIHPMEQNHYRINAEVKFIGQQFIEPTTDTDGNLTGWNVKTGDYRDEPNEGVFANNANITNLVIGEKLSGISDYAFQGCATLQSVSFGNNLTTIGNGAFANCIRLADCNMETNSNIQALGKDAFYNCTALTDVTIPINVKAIGDSCFEGCTRLVNVDLCGGSNLDTMLQTVGNSAFKNCSSLGSIIFPAQYCEDDLQISVFEGCSSLQYIQVQNKDMNFKDTEGYTFEMFKGTVPESFYIIGPLSKIEEDKSKSPIHTTANDNSIAFKYPDQELYEVVKEEKASAGTTPDPVKITYQVNNLNELVKVLINGQPENITLPETIGPYGISSIGQGSFNDSCYLRKITIPATVTSIGSNAFQGCHNLRTVIFTDASTIQIIDTNAFKTQDATCPHQKDLNDPSKNMGQTTDDVSDDPSLTFVGKMMNDQGQDTVPFIFAMNGASNINNANQEKIWITCHSGWPTNLEVQYNYDPISNIGEAMLIGYPKFAMIKDTVSAEKWVESLPYVTSENMSEYKAMVTKATNYYRDPNNNPQPTENEMAIVNSSLNVVIPSSVDSIKPGLFSGFIPDADGEVGTSDTDGSSEWDKVDNINLSGGATSTSAVSQPDTDIQTVVLNGVKEIEPFTFKNCTSLREADVIGPTYIDDYAFAGPDEGENFTPDAGNPETMQLSTVTLGTNLTDTGKRPFRGCEALNNITCLDSDFVYNNGILYRNTGSGLEIVECLESRGLTGGIGSYSVGPEELAGVTTMKEEAFEDCDGVGKIDISGTAIEVIPERAFAATDDLNTVVFGDTVTNIEAESFRDSAIRLLTIPGNQVYIAQDAFATSEYLELGNHDEQQTIIFECVEGLYADRYAKEDENWYINPEYGKVFLTHTVYFFDYPNYPDTSVKEVYYKVDVKDGEDAIPPTDPPTHEGALFNRWTDYTNVTKDLEVYPIFGDNVYKVEFRDTDGTLLGEVQFIEEGKSATPPADPTKEGYTFTGWSQSWHDVKQDLVIIATYSDNSGDASRHTVTFYGADGTIHSQQSVNHGEGAVTPQDPVKSGYKFLGWIPANYSNVQGDMTIIANFEKIVDDDDDKDNDKDSDKDKDKDKTTTEASKKKYTVSVSGGSGSGSYAAGDIVAINAYFRGTGQIFDKWTTSTAGVGFANNEAASTTFTMPATNVAVTATYKVGGASTTTTTGGNTTGGTTGTTSSGNVNGSSVQITKPGISNTGLAGATVSGATDNFIVKVTEDQNATNAVVTALQTKFGDISRIKYWPMDISLYDSTGRTKIADTSGISVNLTLPIPDELVQYAGNNRVAAVNGGVLEDLNTRFTTVDGVPCVNFTASHFSPYVIYVDTANLSAGTIDATPKTGDGIHPKWFLSIGMACIALVLFFKRDKAVVPARTA